MNILQLCQKPPFPPVDGGAIAMNNITQGLLNGGHRVKVISVTTAKHPVKPKDLPKNYVEATQFESVFIDTRIKRKDAFLNLFSKKSYNIERFICNDLKTKISSVLQQTSFDLVILEGLFVAPYIEVIQKNFNGKIVLRAHNVEYKIWERMSENAKNPIKKSYLQLLTKRLRNFEIQSFNKVNGICAMTKIDCKTIQKMGTSTAVGAFPSGYDLKENGTIPKIKEEKALFHIASMDWHPNQEAVDWFLQKVWPLVLQTNKNAVLYLAGREMPKRYKTLKIKGVKVVGAVPVAKDFYASKKIMIVPLLSGSGMRIKIIEGMAMGKVIVSTSIGAEGIHYTHGKNILIADEPESFALAITKVLNNETYCDQLSKNAKELIAKEYNNDVVCEKLVKFIEQL